MIRGAAATPGATLRSLGLELRDFLLRARQAADAEIRTYPTPIPRCDAQFNFVYEQRLRLSGWLNALDIGLGRYDDAVALASMMAEFCRGPATGESSEERALRDRIAAALSAAHVRAH